MFCGIVVLTQTKKRSILIWELRKQEQKATVIWNSFKLDTVVVDLSKIGSRKKLYHSVPVCFAVLLLLSEEYLEKGTMIITGLY